MSKVKTPAISTLRIGMSFNGAGLTKLIALIEQQAATAVIEPSRENPKTVKLGPYTATLYTNAPSDRRLFDTSDRDGLAYGKSWWHVSTEGKERERGDFLWSSPGEEGLQQAIGYLAKMEAFKQLTPADLHKMVVEAQIEPTHCTIDKNGLYA